MKTKAHITSRGETRSIFIRLSFGAYEKVEPNETYKRGRKYSRIEYYTGETVKPKDWDIKKGAVKNNSFLNGQIEKGKVRIAQIYHEATYNGKLSPGILMVSIKSDESLSEIFNKKRIIEKPTEYKPPFEFIEEFIQKAIVSDGTRKDYTNTLNHLKEFDQHRGKVASWKGIDYDYYLGLVEYLKTKKRLKASTTDKVVKNLKVFLSQADTADNIEVNQDFKKVLSNKSLFGKTNKAESEHVYLDEIEIQRITNAIMTDDRLGEIRDLFLIGCWTGLRISDLSRLETGNIRDGLVTITTQKTHQNVVIPVTEELQMVLDKYPDRLPKIPTDQHYNREIKKVCKEASINDMIMAEVKTGDLTVTAPLPKYELITSHTARRSFATNLYRRGIPSTQLMFLTGHKTEDAFLKYIKVSKEDNARDVAKKLKKIG